MFKLIWDAIKDFLFPPRCPLCDAYVEHSGAWCPNCLAVTVSPHFVPLKNKKMYDCLDGTWVMGSYDGVLRDLILDLKFRGLTEKAAFLQTFTLAADKGLILPQLDLAATVPLHTIRREERGFNQVDLIFARWLDSRRLPCCDLLKRTKNTHRQYELKAAERQKNMSEAFALAPGAAERIVGQSILLLDDILTTGSTMAECAKTLKLGGARFVYALALAGEKLGAKPQEK